MKKITGEHLLWIGCGAGFAGFLVSLILMASVQEGASLWLFGVGPKEIACGVLYIGTAVLMICFAWIGCLSVERWWARAMILVLLVVLLCIALLVFVVGYAFSGSASYFLVSAPDGEHTIVVCESGILATKWATVYQLTSPVTMVEIGSCPYKSATPGNYDITWYDSYFVIIARGESVRINYR